MNKMLYTVAILLGVIAIARSTSANPQEYYPLIVAKGRIVDQTSPIGTTTIFTIPQTGLYRLSVYGTLPKVSVGSNSQWYYVFNWTDDAGAEQSNGYIMFWDNARPAPAAYATSYASSPGNTVTFEAVGGTSLSYAVNIVPSGSDGSVYSLYYTIERL